MKRLPRVKPNPMAEQIEQRHGDMLDEIHRLIAGDYGGRVTTPHGVRLDGQAIRRSTDEECRWGDIWFDKELSFRVDGEDVVEAAASELERFAKELIVFASRIRNVGKRLNGSQPSPKRKRGAA